MIRKPMLAGTIQTEEGLHLLRYPVLGTPKIDGIRTLIVNGRAVSRTLKSVPNHHVRTIMEEALPEGADGEFIIPDTPFEEISGAWRAQSGKPQFRYMMFDHLMRGDISEQYHARMARLEKMALPEWVDKLVPLMLSDVDEVLAFEDACLKQGFEGIMLRDPKGPYKFGRSTLQEGYLLKFKRFVDAEAEVIGFQELMSNKNLATTNALGHTERSGHKANLVPMGTLGALIVRGLNGTFEDVEFNIGTGFDTSTRQLIWNSKGEYLGRTVTYTFQDIGVKDCPRFPRFKTFRADT